MLWEKRMAIALKWLGFLNNSVHREEDGSMTLILTNQDMFELFAEIEEIKTDN